MNTQSRSLTCRSLIAILATLSLASAAEAAMRVVAMPGRQLRPGVSIPVWGAASNGGSLGDGTANGMAYSWSFTAHPNVQVVSDGSLSGTVGSDKDIVENVTFNLLNGSTREAIIGTLTVNGKSDTVFLDIVSTSDVISDSASENLSVNVNIAVENGKRYLYLSQQSDGRWPSSYACAITGFVVWGFSNAGHVATGDPDNDVYVETVQKGVKYILSQSGNDSYSNQTYIGNPDVNGNGRVIYTCLSGATSESGYSNPIALLGVVAAYSANPNATIPAGWSYAGATFKTYAQDAGEQIMWAQGEGSEPYGRGGWYYSANSSSGDGSIESWNFAALEAVESIGGSVPDAVKSEVEYRLAGGQHSTSDDYFGVYGYTSDCPIGGCGTFPNSSGNGNATTAAALSGLALVTAHSRTPTHLDCTVGASGCRASANLPSAASRKNAAAAFLGKAWNVPFNSSWNGNRGNHYAMWTQARAFRLNSITSLYYPGDGVTFDWQTGAPVGSPDTIPAAGNAREGLFPYLVRTQSSNGSWATSSANSNYDSYFNTGTALLIMQQTVFGPPEVDLVLTLSDSPDPVAAGGTLTYTIGVTNNGPSNAAGVTVTDTLPAGLTFQSGSGCSATGQDVTCLLSSINAGSSTSKSFTVLVSSSLAPTTLSNSATVTSASLESNAANNTASTTTTTNLQADLAVSKTDSVDPVTAGNGLSYTLTVTNNGPSNSGGATLTDVVPAGLTIVSATGCGIASQTVTCAVPAQAAGASSSWTIVTTVAPATRGTLSNTATLSGQVTTDPGSGNNSATQTTTVSASADLSIAKSASPDPIIPTSPVTYSLLISNAGPSTSTSSTISDTLPSGLSFASSASGCSAVGQVVTCSAGAIAPSGNTTVTFVANTSASIAGTANVVNTATVSGTESDPVSANNSSTVTTPVKPQTITLAFSLASSSVAESGTASLVVTLTTSDGGLDTFMSSSVNYATVEGTATEPEDYTLTSGTLTFPAGTASGATQTISVPIASDLIDEGASESFSVTLASPSHAVLGTSTHAVTITDDDVAGVTVSAAAATTLNDRPAQSTTFTVVLATQPLANVVIALGTTDTSECNPGAAAITFTAANWSSPQTVTVSAYQDETKDGDQPCTITVGGITSADGLYAAINPDDRSFTIHDTDVPAITVSPTSGLNTTEGGATTSFTVVLETHPSADVSLLIYSSDTTEGTVPVSSLTFTPANSRTPQTVTATGVDDSLIDGTVLYSIVTGTAVSADTNYNGINPPNVTIGNLDNEAAGFVFSATSGLNTFESGQTTTFTVTLTAQPTANVTFGLTSSDTTEGTVSPATLVFTAADWNNAAAHTVTLTGVDDAVADGDQPYTIVTGAAASSDGNFNNLNPSDVTVTNRDDDTPGVTVQPTSGLTTTEAGGQATFTVRLNSQPTAAVTVAISSDDSGEGTISPVSLTFTAANWSTQQTVTATGVDDLVDDGDQSYHAVVGATSSSDPLYNGINPEDVSLTNSDDDAAGLTLTPSSGLLTSEDETTATFTVALTSMPTANVTVALASSDPTEASVSPSSLTFTAADYTTPQTVTVTGVDDPAVDHSQPFAISTSAAASADPVYAGLATPSVGGTNSDNDTAGITVTPASGPTTEAGGTATFSVVLDTLPAAPVVIPLLSTDTSEGTVPVAELTFTPANWNVPQVVTVTGVDDAVADGDQAYAAALGEAESLDADYDDVEVDDVALLNQDNDAIGITVSPLTLTTSEAGATAQFSIVLSSEPTHEVTVTIASSDPTEGTTDLATLVFTAANWGSAASHTVTVTGQDDPRIDGNVAYTIVTSAAASDDPLYQGVDPADVAVTNNDNDNAAIVVDAISGPTTEAGGTATFVIRLTAEPDAAVSIALSSSDGSEGTVSPVTAVLDASNWSGGVLVTVTGVDDLVDDGDIAYSVITAVATSADPHFAGLDAADVALSNLDNDAAGISVLPTSGLSTTEAGGTATFDVVLLSQPVAPVTITLASSDTTEASVPASLTFTALDWAIAQSVTVTGQDDLVDDGNQAFTIVTGTSTADPLYAAIDPANVAGTNLDDDTAGVTVGAASAHTTEAGGTATFEVVLTSQPTANVTVALSSFDASEGTVAPTSLTFTAANWNTPQTATVTGQDDSYDDGDLAYSIVTGISSTDPVYAAIDPADVSVVNDDDDTAGYDVTPLLGLVTTEAGGTATFQVRLTAEPINTVFVSLSSSDTSEGTVPATITFNTDWNVYKTVTVTGVNDDVDDGDISYTVQVGPMSSSDPAFRLPAGPTVAVVNTDNDNPGISIGAPATTTIAEPSGSTTFRITLLSQPTAAVTIPLSSTDATACTPSPASAVLTAANWSTGLVVTIQATDDWVDDGSQTCTIVTGSSSSTEGGYQGIDPADVGPITVTDEDVAGIVVAPTSGLETDEAGATATFTVVLTSQPVADVTVPLYSSDLTEGSIDKSGVTFTAANWNTPQTVTVTGLPDAIIDGNVDYTIVTEAASSADPLYSGINPSNVDVTNIETETAGFTVTPLSITTSEPSVPATFTVALLTQPAAAVTIALSSTDTTEGTVSPSSLTFTGANWGVPQTVTVTGQDDAGIDGDIGYSIVLAPAVSMDGDYNGRNPQDVAATNEDDDVAGFSFTPASLLVSENGAAATAQVHLTSQPTASVTITLQSSDSSEGTVAPASLTFTPAGWNVNQAITLTPVDDAVQDGSIAYSIQTVSVTSADTHYNGLVVAAVPASTADDDTAGITVFPTDATTVENGANDSFTVVLQTQPTADVTVSVSSGDSSEGTVAPASLTFTSANWNVPKTVTVTPVDDDVADGEIDYTIELAAASADPIYAAIDPADVAAANGDDDSTGIVVNPTSGLTTTEAGGTAAFTVVLSSEPTGPVAISLASDDTSEGVAAPASLTFTPANWNVPQTVTVTGVDDPLIDGTVVYHVVLDAASSTDPGYAGVDPADVTVGNSSDDTAGIVVAPTVVTTSENLGTATFVVTLTAEPAATVEIPVSSLDASEASVAPASAVLDATNWSTGVTVTVTGVDDVIIDGTQGYTIQTAAAVSADPHFAGLDADDVAGSNLDNDVAGGGPEPTAGLVTTETGGSATFVLRLASMPAAPVSIALSSSNTGEGTVSPATAVLNASNWSNGLTVTVTGVNEFIDDGDQSYQVITAPATSSDPNYAGLDLADVSLVNEDNDTAEIVASPPTPPTTSEGGATSVFTVQLASQPLANVTVAVTSADESEGVAAPTSLTFTPVTWNVGQTVTVTGQDDGLTDGPMPYQVVVGPGVSTDPKYQGLVGNPVALVNTDDDAAGVLLTPSAGLLTGESGSSATFTIVLTAQPTATVTIGLSSSDLSEGTVAPSSVSFTTANWNVPQTVTVTGVDDAAADGNVAYLVVTAPAVSGDAAYSGYDASDVGVTNTDDDAAGITVAPTSGLVTTESGGTATFTVVLNSQPTTDVIVDLASSDTSEGTVSPSSLTFSTANWSVPRTITVTGQDDVLVDGAVAFAILTTATSGDPLYAAIDPADVAVTNSDNDSPGIVVSPTSGLVTTEAGGTAQFAIVLASQPTANVTIALTSSDTTEATVAPASVTFTPANWNVTQHVTATGVDDAIDDGNIAYTLETAAAVSSDPAYAGLASDDVAASNSDDDTAGIQVSPTAGLVTTEAGGQATFTIVLSSQPMANVTVSAGSSDASEGSASPASLTFTAANWNVAQTVTVSGQDDLVVDGNVAYAVVVTATSGDPVYAAIDPADVSATNLDNDAGGIVVSPTAGLVTTEAGGQATFTVVLTSQPTANVMISASSNDGSEGTAAPASLTFTAANWSVAQTVTVTGVDDDIDDGDAAYGIVVGASSTDPLYAAINPADVAVSNSDNDAAGIVVSPTAGLVTTEAGGQATFTVVLTSQPTANVIISASSNDGSEGTAAPASLTFTAVNWSVAQTVTVTGVDDAIDDGNVAYGIVVGASSSDPLYAAIDPADVAVSNSDNEAAGIVVSPTAGLVTTEAGGQATFTVVLTSQPTANVIISASSNDSSEGTATPASLTFTAANWNLAQTVTVTGVDDAIDDGNVAYGIVVGASSTDPVYAAIDPADVAVSNSDNDTAGIVVSPTAGLVTTEAGGQATFTVVLTSQPTANVIISVSSNDSSEGTAAPASLTFTAANWSLAQTVTVTGEDDAVVDGTVAYVVVNSANSGDPLYGVLNPADVAVSNTDNEVADSTPPQVALVSTVADTGDGVLASGEATIASITQVYLVFNEAMRLAEVGSPTSYRVVSGGANLLVETAGCGALAGDDVEVGITAVSYDAATRRAAMALDTTAGLPAGVYAASGCAVLADEAGNLLDGNGNGTGGDDFTRYFGVELSNELTNPTFDRDLAGWTGTAAWSSADADGKPTSGSMRFAASGMEAVRTESQCLTLDEPGGLIRASASGRVASGTLGWPAVSMLLDFHQGSSCSGTPLSSVPVPVASGPTGGVWAKGEVRVLSVPAGVQSVRVWMVVDEGFALAYTIDLDNPLLAVDSDLLDDGFESGTLFGWSATH